MAVIGIFDSGCGGLSVFKEIYRRLPEERYLYFADNAYCPYGAKSRDAIIARSRAVTERLLSMGAEIIVIACNTATGAAISTLRASYPVRFIGMEPAIKPAALATATGVIGVLATAGTLHGRNYLSQKKKYKGDIRIAERTGEGWVELVEKGLFTGPEAERTVRASLQPLLDEGADRIVLGCTHYPFLSETIRKIAGPGIRLHDPAPAVARQLVQVLLRENLIDRATAERAEEADCAAERRDGADGVDGATERTDGTEGADGHETGCQRNGLEKADDAAGHERTTGPESLERTDKTEGVDHATDRTDGTEGADGTACERAEGPDIVLLASGDDGPLKKTFRLLFPESRKHI